MPAPPRSCRTVTIHLLAALTATVTLATSAAAEGLLPLHYDRDEGRILLEIPALDAPLIYTNTLAGGAGTTSPLLDRGQTGVNALVRFERHGPKVLLVQDNTDHRALDGREASRLAVAESFPRSVLAAMPVESDDDNGLVVDATDFILSDVWGVTERLRAAEAGEAELDRTRSHINERFSGSFETNTEIRAALTFNVRNAAARLAHHLPDPRVMSIEQHHSFIALPEDGYSPREFHPRAGIFPHMFFDFSLPLTSDYRQRWIARWRLVPSDPDAYLDGELVEPENPIVYHLDPAIPEPYRTAFREGGLWWNQAFEAAGFKDAFRILDLPEDANPMDARYNLIHWVHRQERGPSVGPHYNDPRTGEIIRTVVRMDSFRSLVNHDIWMGFLPAAGRDGLALDAEEMAMARRRQHSAHEIGHTLGLAHNFIAASHARASVMDYPVPLVRLDDDGHLDLSDAYADGIGDFDRFAIRYAYTWFPDADAEREGLQAIVDELDDSGLRFITGGHAAPQASMPDATVWVEGNDMFEATERTLTVRARLLENFDERALNAGEPHFLLNKRFAHVYLHHRTALQGLTKHVGGMDFAYTLAGDDLAPTAVIPADRQRAALELLLSALEPDALSVPERVNRLMTPEPFGWSTGWRGWVDERLIESPAGTAFDPTDLAHSLAQELIDNLLHRERLARVASFHARDPEQPSLHEVFDALLAATWGQQDGGVLRELTQRAALDGLLDLAGDARATARVRAAAAAALSRLQAQLDAAGRGRRAATDADREAHLAAARRDLRRYFDGRDDPELRPRPAPVPLPWP